MEKEQEILNENVEQETTTIEETVVEEVKEPVMETAETPEAKSKKRILQGVVVSNKGDKSIVIKVVRQVAHPLYKKYYKKSKKFMAHDANNDCNIGDTVKVRECRPMSSRKTWELVEIVQRAK